MGLPTESSDSTISPHVVASVFLEQYYKILHGSPELFYRFYQDSSTLSRPDSNGTMTSVTTTQGINDFILSSGCRNFITEILFADSQQSYKGGVFIQVTGYMIGLDKTRQRFSQSFFLAPQDCGGYFVLNDVFRLVDDSQPIEVNQMSAPMVNDAQPAPLTTEQDLHAPNPPTPIPEVLCHSTEEPCQVAENGGTLPEEECTADQPAQPSNIDKGGAVDVSETTDQKLLSKKSYASILVRGSTTPVPVQVAATKARPSTTDPAKPPLTLAAPAQAPEITTNSSNVPEEGYSVFIRNLPLHVTASQVEEVFKEFGPIKPRGVQVRSHKQDRNCFGFVEFESSDSRQAAVEASSVMIEGHKVFIAEKKTTKRVNGVITTLSNVTGGRGRNFGGRSGSNGGGFQNDYFRGGRGSFGGNQGGYARNDFRNSRGGGDYSGRGRGPPRGRTGEGYQPRAVQNGYGNMSHPNIPNQATVVA